ncbi:MAG: 50S ribosomal protein L29 [Chloroflexi bacterium]|nr:50S ribosomal protein L29 [Chloroflexota bacterium]MCL5950516.1 50S ribosomal protein L29 [Chloroflexota bacterium]
MNTADLTNMDDAALNKQLNDLFQEMFNLRFQRAAGQLPNYNRLTEVKRDIARVKTVLRSRELTAGGKEAKAR